MKYFNLISIIGIIVFIILQQKKVETFPKELTIERLNIVGEDGNPYIVLSGPEHQAIPTQNGVPLDPNYERNVPGIIFFNREGDEVGGLIYDIYETSNFHIFTFDQRKNDQILVLRNDETFRDGKWNRRYGLQVLERGDKTSVERVKEYDSINAIKDSVIRKKLFKDYFANKDNIGVLKMHVGRLFNGKTGLFLFDDEGKTRLAIYLDENGNPMIEKVEK